MGCFFFFAQIVNHDFYKKTDILLEFTLIEADKLLFKC